MNPATIVALANGLLTLLERLLPDLQQAFKSGQITPEEQSTVRARFDALRQDAAWTGPEWEKE